MDKLCVLPGLSWPINVKIYSEEKLRIGELPAFKCYVTQDDAKKILHSCMMTERIKDVSKSVEVVFPVQSIVNPVNLSCSDVKKKRVNDCEYNFFTPESGLFQRIYLLATPAPESILLLPVVVLGIDNCEDGDAIVDLPSLLIIQQPDDSALTKVHGEGRETWILVSKQRIYSCKSIEAAKNAMSRLSAYGQMFIQGTKDGESVCLRFISPVSTESSDDDKHKNNIAKSTEPHDTLHSTKRHLQMKKLSATETKGVYEKFEGLETEGRSHNDTENNELIKERQDKKQTDIGKGSIDSGKFCGLQDLFVIHNFRTNVDDPSKQEDMEVDSTMEISIIVFACCFGCESDTRIGTAQNVSLGDNIVLQQSDGDEILGDVKFLCYLSQSNFVKPVCFVEFEDPIKFDKSVIRHLWDEDCPLENDCIKSSRHFYIPVEYLPEKNRSLHNIFRHIRNSSDDRNQNHAKEINYEYEKTRHESMEPPLTTIAEDSRFGIEGFLNSCYVDSSIFALFAFNGSFDSLLDKPFDPQSSDYETAAKNILKYDIISKIRGGFVVSSDSVYKLRRVLKELLPEHAYLNEMMDAETLIGHLLTNVLKAPELYCLSNETKDHVLQIFPPKKCHVKVPAVSYLIQDYSAENLVQINKISDHGILVKLPVCEGNSVFEQIYVDLSLNFDAMDKPLSLTSVICLNNNHFTCFVRVRPQAIDVRPTWYFHDSMCIEADHILTLCPDMEECIRAIESNHYIKEEMSFEMETLKAVHFLLNNAYICLYTR